MQLQPVNRSNPTGLGIRTNVQAIPTEVAREVMWDLSNRYPSSSQPTIGSVINSVLIEDLLQPSMKPFSTDYHALDNLFLVDDHIPEESSQADITQQNQPEK